MTKGPAAVTLERPRLTTGLAAMGAALLAACSLAPTQTPPLVPLAASWKSTAPAGWVSTEALRHWQTGHWWRLFGDTELDALMARVELHNPSLAQALANVAQADALARQANAALWPTLGVQASTQRSGRPAGGSASAGLSASWAPDLWGRLADTARAQDANVQASQADLAAARLAAQGSLATSYFALRAADAELALLDDILVGYQRAARITGNRYDVGVAAHTDLLQAHSTLASAQASRVALQGSRDQLEHAVALLVGVPPAAFDLAPATWATQVPAVPPELPAALLLRRPDVAAAERAVAAANAGIGVARAAWFPGLNLSVGLGGSAGSLADLAATPTLAWSLGASLAQTLLDAGARSAAVDAALAAHQAASASYRQTALTAMGEVEDQLTALATLAVQIEHVRTAADAAAAAEQRIMNSYEAGLADYTSVVTAQASTLTSRRTVMQLQLQRQQAAIGLIQALGGGWQAPWLDTPNAVQPQETS
ncbi:MAG: efflux transporter outer membrane subunit [Proteobacteria bacterium]|nr:efflux transporter outer membrane subunit [Pseudomonadota bacterium]